MATNTDPAELLEELKEVLRHPDIDDATYNLRMVHEMLGLPIPDYLETD